MCALGLSGGRGETETKQEEAEEVSTYMTCESLYAWRVHSRAHLPKCCRNTEYGHQAPLFTIATTVYATKDSTYSVNGRLSVVLCTLWMAPTAIAAAAAVMCVQEKPSADECGKFGKLWKEFGRALKLGIVEDNNNRCVECVLRCGLLPL